MGPNSILETVLYNADLETARWFYETVIGLDVVSDMSDTGFACRVDEHHVLLVFDPRESDKPGRSVPAHGARGPGHVALRIDEDQYDAWVLRLSELGVPVEDEIVWDDEKVWRTPGRSVYVRDPYGNSVELITADIWGVDPKPRPESDA